LRFRKLFLDNKISDPNQPSWWTGGLRPNIVMAIFCKIHDESDGTAIASPDRSEYAFLIDEERIIYSDPETTCMVFEK